MTLTTCPECGRKVSTKAPACPHCGNPVTTEVVEASLVTDDDSEEEDPKRDEEWCRLPWYQKAFGLLISFGAIALVGATIGGFIGWLVFDSILVGAGQATPLL